MDRHSEREIWVAEEIAELASEAYDHEFRPQDIIYGKWNFKGGREVFAHSWYLGYLLNGRLYLDRKGAR